MAEFKTIKGQTIQNRTSDPLVAGISGATWSSGSTAPQTTQSGGSFGTSTAAVSTGGYDGEAYVQTTIEFNGSAWSSGGSMNRPAGQSFNGLGTESSGGIAGGYKTSGNAVVNNFESYNGSAFTETTDLNTARQNSGSTGASNTAAIIVGGTTGVGSPPDTTGNNNVEIWNGSSWTETAEINTARYAMRALGSTCPAPTAVIAGGENSGTKTGITEEFDGTSWTETTDMNTARSQGGAAGNVATDGIYFGGEGSAPSYTNYANTEHFDGSTWTEVADLSGTRYSFSTATGTGSAAIAGQGRNPGFTGLTEIWKAAGITDSIVTEGQMFYRTDTGDLKVTLTDYGTGAWSSGGNLNAPGTNSGSASNGTPTATLVFAGDRPSRSTVTESYNGSAWTEVNDMNEGRNNLGGFGLQGAANGFGGGESTTVNVVSNESWNGTSWTEVNNLNTARAYVAGCGLQTAGLAIGNAPNAGITEDFDGTSWTERGDMNTGRFVSMASGSPTAAIVTGGANPSDGSQAVSEQFDGTTWTEVGDLNTGRQGGARFGNKTLQVVAGGYNGTANVGITESFNGTSWTEVADLSIGRNSGGNMSSGTGTTAGIVFGGTAPGGAATEEWTVPSSLTSLTITD